MVKQQFTLYLENKPGALAKATKDLAKSKVNIEGISVSASADVGLVQMVVDNAKLAKQALTRSGISFTVQKVALVALRNNPGALFEVVSRLARSRININYVYATACECDKDCGCYAIISAPDLKAVEAACKTIAR